MSIIHKDILKRYDDMLEEATRLGKPGWKPFPDDKTSFPHLRWMLIEMETMTDVGKANRWLGFIQGIMIAKDLTTVEAERDFTRPYFTKPAPKAEPEAGMVRRDSYDIAFSRKETGEVAVRLYAKVDTDVKIGTVISFDKETTQQLRADLQRITQLLQI